MRCGRWSSLDWCRGDRHQSSSLPQWADIRWTRYVVADIAAALLWSAVYAATGLLGRAVFSQAWEGVVAGIALVIVISLAANLWTRRRRPPLMTSHGSNGRSDALAVGRSTTPDITVKPTGPEGRWVTRGTEQSRGPYACCRTAVWRTLVVRVAVTVARQRTISKRKAPSTTIAATSRPIAA